MRTSQIEATFTSLERCIKFTEIPPEEGYHGLPELEKRIRRGTAYVDETIQRGWPYSGKLEINNLYLKYRPDLDYVLKGVNVVINGGEKVGLVGRTGAGKSTLITALYGSFADYEGAIKIDEKEIKSVGLKTLRGNMSVIPQDPYLFKDTIQANIDPLCVNTDQAVIDMLIEVGLWDKFSLEGGLKFKVEKGGKNLSQGEKQLICLTRALLSGNKFVLMDEATANIDNHTESMIQELIKTKFSDSTIIMIAHRLNTILHCDK